MGVIKTGGTNVFWEESRQAFERAYEKHGAPQYGDLFHRDIWPGKPMPLKWRVRFWAAGWVEYAGELLIRLAQRIYG